MSLSNNPSTFAGGKKGESDSSFKTLLNANNLDSYVLPSALSVTVARAHKQSYATATEFKTNVINTISFLLTPGSDYVYGPDSYITFKLTTAGGGDAAHSSTWGQDGTVLNMIQSVRLTHASGTEVEFQNHANLLNMYKTKYDRDHEWRDTYGSAMGGSFIDKKLVKSWVSATSGGAVTSAVDHHARGQTLVSDANNGSTDTFYSIPLSILSEFFNSDKLLPPYALAGMRVELEMASPNIALETFVTATGAPIASTGDFTFSVTNLRVQLDSHTLTDSVQKGLARMSANEGLDLHFSSWFHDRHTMAGSEVTVNVTKALSRVEDIQIVSRQAVQYTDVNAATAVQSLQNEAAYLSNTSKKWQISIGSMFFPSHPVSDTHSAYMLAQQGRKHTNRVSYDDFALKGLGIVRGALERSQILNGSGIAISATRGATIQYTDNNGSNPTLDLFVKHTRLVSVFLDNVVVRT